jgi:hypothetical protein
VLLNKCFDLFEALLVIERQNGQSLGSKALVELLYGRHFLPTGDAPGGPKIEEDELSPIVL